MPEKKPGGGEGLKYVIIFGVLFIIGILGVWGITGRFPGTQPEKPKIVEKGDLISINYTGWHDNGSLFDSGTLEFRPGTGQMKLKGLDEGVLGMRVGENRMLNLTPEYAFGEYDPGFVIKQPRLLITNSTITFPTTPEQFNETFGGMPETGLVISSVNLPWRRVEILDFTSTTMTWRLMPPEGHKTPWPFDCSGWNEIALTTDCYGTATMRPIDDGERIEITIEPYLGEKVNMGGAEARVIGADNESIYLDFNHELAGKGFIYSVTLLELEKG